MGAEENLAGPGRSSVRQSQTGRALGVRAPTSGEARPARAAHGRVPCVMRPPCAPPALSGRCSLTPTDAVEVLIIRVSKRDFMWKKGLYRGNRANPQGQCGRQSRRRRKVARWLECRVCKAQNAEDRPRERPGGRRPWSRRRGAWPCGHLVFSRTAELPGHKFQFLEHRDGSRGKPTR